MTNREVIQKLIAYYKENDVEQDWYLSSRLIQLATRFGTCDEMRAVIDMYDGRFYRSGPLAIACQLGDVEKVRFLLSKKFCFSTDKTNWTECAYPDAWNDALSLCSKYTVSYSNFDTDWVEAVIGDKLQDDPMAQVSLAIRMEILKILIENNENCYAWEQFDYSGFLLRALLYGDIELVNACVAEGIAISAESFADVSDIKFALCQRLAKLAEQERAEVFSILCDCAASAGTEIVMTKDIFQCGNAMFTAAVLQLVLQRCNLKRIKKEDIIFAIIDMNQAKLLNILEENRFLDQLAVRKKAKEYAAAKKKNRVLKWFESAEDRIVKNDKIRKAVIKENDEKHVLSEKCFTHKGSVLTGISKQGIKQIQKLGITELCLPKTLNAHPITTVSPLATKDWEEQLPQIVAIKIPEEYTNFISEHNGEFHYFPSSNSVKTLIFEDGDLIDNISINPSVEQLEITGGKKYVSAEGVIYSSDMTELVYYPRGKCEETYTVPNSVKTIRKYALARCVFTDLIIPDSVEILEDGVAWDSCIHHIYVGSGIKVIPKKTFASCGETTELRLSEGLEEIGEEAFSYCAAKLITIPTTVRMIEEGAFKNSKAQFEFESDDVLIMPGAFEKCVIDMASYSDKLRGKMNRCGLNQYGCADVFKGKTRDEFIRDLQSVLPEYEVTEEMTLHDIRNIIEKKALLDNCDELLNGEPYDSIQFERRFKLQNLLEAALFFEDKDVFARIFQIGYAPEKNYIIDKILPKQDWFELMVKSGFQIERYPRVAEIINR